MSEASSHSSSPSVFLRDREHCLQLGRFDNWQACCLVGALSADPRTLAELARAWRRYAPEGRLEEDAAPLGDAAPDGPWLLIDLACQRLVCGGGEELPENPAAYQRDEGPWSREMPVVWINLPPGWECLEQATWEHALPPLPPLAEPLDFRGVLFGRALAAGIAQRTLEIARAETLPANPLIQDELPLDSPLSDEQRVLINWWHERTVQVHADWLMEPREDLEGEPPRVFLHRGRDWVEREMHNRQSQWTQEGKAPVAVERDSFAYRYGPPGRNEVVMYFDLCREVIDAAWRKILAEPQIDEDRLSDELYQHAQRWLNEGSIDDDPTPPATIIASERQRIPLTGDFDILDHDCPICRMLAEGAEMGFGPSFRDFDGHHLELDDEFAFSLCETREEWDQQQADFQRMTESFEMQRNQEETDDQDASEEADSVWTQSYQAEGQPLTAMSLAFRLAEIVNDMQAAGVAAEQIEVLNQAFEACRHADWDPSLLQSARCHLSDRLEDVAADHRELIPKVADFQSQLDQWAREQGDMDLPF